MKDLSAMLDAMSCAQNPDEFNRLREVLESEVAKSHDPVLLGHLGQIYRKRQIWRDAERFLKEAIKWGPSMPEPYRDLGLLYIHRDDMPWPVSLRCARDTLEEAVKVEKIGSDPSAVTHTLLGRVLESLGEPENAEIELRAALQINPHYEEAQYNLAMLLDESKRQEKIALLRQSIAEDPEYFLALRDLGFELVKSKEPAEAEAILNRALELDPTDVSLRWYLGQLKWMQQDLPLAELHFRKAMDLDPGNNESRRLLGRFYQYTGRVQEANHELFCAIELDPANEDSVSAYRKFLGEFEDRDFAAGLYSAAKQNSLLSTEQLKGLDEGLF